LPSTIIYRPTNETQEYGKDDWSKRIESSLCSGLPCQGLTGSNLVVLLTPNYSISSTGLFRANRRNLPSLICTIQACQRGSHRTRCGGDPLIAHQLHGRLLCRRALHAAELQSSAICRQSQQYMQYRIAGHSIIIVASRRFTGRSDSIRSPAIRTPKRATQRVGLDIAWRDGVLVHPSPALPSPLLSSLRLALSQTRLSAQCSLLCLAADSKDEEDDMPSRPEEAVFLYLNQVEPSSGPPVSLLRVCAIFDN
jgi:hypothetical protein